MSPLRSLLLHLAPATLLAGLAAAQTSHEVLFVEMPSSPMSEIPGTGGALFESFDDIDLSPNGAHWTLHARSTASSSFDGHFLVNGQLVLREFFGTLPWDPTQGYRGGWSNINDAGQVGLAVESSGSKKYLVRGESAGQGAWTVLAEDGDTIPGAGGATWSNFFAATITTDARLGAAGQVAGGGEASMLDGSVDTLTQTTVPSGSSSGAPVTQIQAGDWTYQVSDDGSTRAFLGAVGSQIALVVNNHVALETGSPVPGSGFTRAVQRITGQHVDPAGRSFGWGLNAVDGHDWVVRDGNVIVQEFDPIVPGSNELWGNPSSLSPAFFHAVGNRAGDYIVVGRTRQQGGVEVMVMNGDTEVIRSGDPIDVDGNGLFDDNAQLGLFREIGGWGDDGSLLAVVTLQTSTFGLLGDAVIRFDVQGSGLGSVYCTSAGNSTGAPATLVLSGSDVASDNDLRLGCSNLPLQSFGYFLASRGQASVPGAGGSQGTLCLGGSIGRGVGGGAQSSGTTGAVSVVVDLTAIPTPTGTVAAVAGETWSFQYWYRDANPSVTSNLSPGVELTLR